jgi:hypothetical protein
VRNGALGAFLDWRELGQLILHELFHTLPECTRRISHAGRHVIDVGVAVETIGDAQWIGTYPPA